MKKCAPFFAVAVLGTLALLSGCTSYQTSTSPTNPVVTVSTLAGEVGYFGANNGAGVTATFNTPNGVALDPQGNVYVGDGGNDLIRLISPAGVVSTYAGVAGSAGNQNGLAVTATFNAPNGVALDPSGNLYVADTNNQMIRLITPGGSVTTYAGTGGQGANNAAAPLATFCNPEDVALDGAGNLYVADSCNNLIRKITPGSGGVGGTVSTFAGQAGIPGYQDGPGATALFYSPQAVATDTKGNVYVADAGNQVIRKITPGGVVSTYAGQAGNPGFQNGPVTAAQFSEPDGLVMDKQGNLYVSDSYNNSIRKIIPQGYVSTFAGSGRQGEANGPALQSSFNQPARIAANAAGTYFVVGDVYNNAIRAIQIP